MTRGEVLVKRKEMLGEDIKLFEFDEVYSIKLPPKMSRQEAFRYYNKKLEKIWGEIEKKTDFLYIRDIEDLEKIESEQKIWLYGDDLKHLISEIKSIFKRR